MKSALPPPPQSKNETECFIDKEKQSFDKFRTHHKGYEDLMFVFYTFIYVVPLCFNIYTLFNIQLPQFAIAFTVTLATEGFLFVNAHLYLHETMLIGYQHKTISSAWAYYHHYVNPMLYSHIPFGYRLSADKGFLFIDICCYLFNVDKYVYALLNIILFIEYLSHEYMHSTRKSHYNSFNPLSSKFILIYYIMKGLESITFIDTVTHLNEHHREKSQHMHLTSDWLDFKVPIVCHLQELIGITEFRYFKNILNVLNGSDKAIFVANKMNIKSKVEILVVTCWVILKNALIIYLLSYLQFYNSTPVTPTIITYNTVLRVVHLFVKYFIVYIRPY